MSVAVALAIALQSISPITVYRDSWGVPSIVAKDIEGMYYGLGYMHVVDNAERVALNYKIARGRSGEVLGRGQLLQDGFVRGLEIEERADAAKISPIAEKVVASYLRGANRALAERRASIPEWIQPFTRTDVLSMGQFINCAFPLLDLASAILPGMGSNQFALGAKRTSTGSPILSMDPHLEWNGADGGIVWYESGLYAPGISFRGVSVPGLPAGVMGHNDRVAWSMTNNDPTLAVRFTVVTNPENRNQYSYHGEWRDFKSKQVKLLYRDGNELKESTQTIRLTDWGPMVPLRSEAGYVEPLGNVGGIEQSLAAMKAKSVSDFRSALAMRGLSMWNFVYADSSGNIAYQYNAFLRRRDPSFNWRQAVPGDTPKTKLGTMLTLDELPHFTNPASGLLINANSNPADTPILAQPVGNWPKYITSYGPTTRFRLLKEFLGDRDSLSVADSQKIATETMLPFAKATVTALVNAGASGPGAEVLRRWDGRSNIDSVGTALYAYWASQDPSLGLLAQKAERKEAWSADEKRKALGALSVAEKNLVRDFGRLDVRWGEVLRMRRGSREIGVSGFGNLAPGFGAAINPSGVARRGPITSEIIANRGSSWRMVVSLVPNHVESWSVLPYGNSQDPKSPYYSNQMSLFSTGRYKKTSFGAEEARRSLTEVIRLDY